MSAASSSSAATRPDDDRSRRLESGYVIEGVRPFLVPRLYATVQPWIDESCERGGGLCDANSLLYLCLQGQAQLWLIRDDAGEPTAAAITEIRDHPLKKALHFIAVGGAALTKWSDCIAVIEQWAASVGCRLIQAEARPGWARHAKAHGYRTAASVLVKELSPAQDKANGSAARAN